jgi:hypothetical protein
MSDPSMTFKDCDSTINRLTLYTPCLILQHLAETCTSPDTLLERLLSQKVDAIYHRVIETLNKFSL